MKFKYKEQDGSDKHQIEKNGYLLHKERDIKLVELTGGFDCIGYVLFLIKT